MVHYLVMMNKFSKKVYELILGFNLNYNETKHKLLS